LTEALAYCRGLSKTYATPAGEIEALHSVDAEFRPGEITAIVGPSGSGKSTLLKTLAGLDRATSGVLTVEGHDLSGASPSSLRRHRRTVVTYVSQKAADNLVPHLRLLEQDDGKSETTLAEFGLAPRLAALPGELSGGEQARAAFALALARRTPLVLADEPTAELDRGSSAPLLTALREHAGAGFGLVVATHDDDVMAIADHVVRLDRGRVVDGKAPSRAARTSAPAPTGEPVLEAQAIAMSFPHGGERVHAVVDATFELRRGELAALLGRSGSGKSTVLAIAAGLQSPDAGELRRATGLHWDELAFLPQRFGLLSELSVRENIELPMRLAGGRGQADELLKRLGLTELADRSPHETSIGQQQRTALARALVLRPAILLADEPTSHQDAGWRDAVWHLLVEAAAEGTACLVATHEPEIATHAARTWQIDSGRISEHAGWSNPNTQSTGCS
jgi:putative ABC transport system ATP-binding protein